MHIHEAILNTTSKMPFITRRAWAMAAIERPIIKILPTNTPDCCVMVSSYSKHGPCRGWQPCADDLKADDWVTCSGSLSVSSRTG